MELTGRLAPLWRVLVRPWADPRYLDRRFDACMPFGAPGTSCLGAAVSIAVARAFVGQLSAYRVTCSADGTHEHDGWHSRPSRNFRSCSSRWLRARATPGITSTAHDVT